MLSVVLLGSLALRSSATEASDYYGYGVRLFYGSSGCEEDSFIAMRGFVSGEKMEVVEPQKEASSCAEALECALEPVLDWVSPTCLSLEPVLADYYFVDHVKAKEGTVRGCQYSKEDDSELECYELGPENCATSLYGPGCFYRIISFAELKQHPARYLRNSDASEVSKFMMLGQYNDDQCQDVAGVKYYAEGAKVHGGKYSNTLVPASVPGNCDAVMSCLFNDVGETCGSIATGALKGGVPFFLKVGEELPYRCELDDPSNCTLFRTYQEPLGCMSSGSFAGKCHFKWIPASMMVSDPYLLQPKAVESTESDKHSSSHEKKSRGKKKSHRETKTSKRG